MKTKDKPKLDKIKIIDCACCKKPLISLNNPLINRAVRASLMKMGYVEHAFVELGGKQYCKSCRKAEHTRHNYPINRRSPKKKADSQPPSGDEKDVA